MQVQALERLRQPLSIMQAHVDRSCREKLMEREENAVRTSKRNKPVVYEGDTEAPKDFHLRGGGTQQCERLPCRGHSPRVGSCEFAPRSHLSTLPCPQ